MTTKKPSTVLEAMMSTREKRAKNMTRARTFIKKRTGRKIKYSHEQVKRLRSEWIASTATPSLSLMHLAVLHKMPIATARHLCYDPGYRKAPEAQPDAESMAKARVVVHAIQNEYDSQLKQERADRKSAKYSGQYSAADLRKLEKTNLAPKESLSDAQRALRGIGNTILHDREQVIQCARLFFQSEGRPFDAELIMKLVQDIEVEIS